MKKAKIISLTLLPESTSADNAVLEQAIYQIFEAIMEHDPGTKECALFLATVDKVETAKRRILVDRVIDRSVVKAVDLDGDGRKELMIYFNCQGTSEPSNSVYIMRQCGRDWECIGQFRTRSLPQVKPARSNGFAELEGTRLPVGGVRWSWDGPPAWHTPARFPSVPIWARRLSGNG